MKTYPLTTGTDARMVGERLERQGDAPGPQPRTDMAAQLQKLNHRHDAIAEWLVANPDKSLSQCAAAMGYTVPWVSQIVNSDMFQAYYRELCAERKELAVHTISAKMNNAAALALDHMIAKLQPGTMPSEKFVGDAADKLLTKLGYSQGDVHLHQHAHAHFTAEDLQRARESATLYHSKSE